MEQQKGYETGQLVTLFFSIASGTRTGKMKEHDSRFGTTCERSKTSQPNGINKIPTKTPGVYMLITGIPSNRINNFPTKWTGVVQISFFESSQANSCVTH